MWNELTQMVVCDIILLSKEGKFTHPKYILMKLELSWVKIEVAKVTVYLTTDCVKQYTMEFCQIIHWYHGYQSLRNDCSAGQPKLRSKQFSSLLSELDIFNKTVRINLPLFSTVVPSSIFMFLTSTPTRPVDNVVITTKGLQDRNINILDGTAVENKGKLVLTEIFPSVQKHDIC